MNSQIQAADIPAYRHGGVSIYHGDCLEVLPQLPERSVHCCVTSPPYWGLRSYLPDGHADKVMEIGFEATLDEFVAKMVEVFRAVWRVLRDDGTLWLNLGDGYANTGCGGESVFASGRTDGRSGDGGKNRLKESHKATRGMKVPHGLKPKDLMGVPWRVAFALQADGWYLRSDIIWHKQNPMPESCTDRPTKSHEHVFLLTKKPRYYYDNEAVRESQSDNTLARVKYNSLHRPGEKSLNREGKPMPGPPRIEPNGRNLRDVWTIPSESFKGAHFATFPRKLIEPCIKAGTSEEGCCPECGAPWKRVMEKERVRTRPGKNSKAYDRTTGEPVEGDEEKPWRDREEIGNRDPGRHVTATKTVGWEPTCKCTRDTTYGCSAGPGDSGLVHKPLTPIPCTVLDPFMGSGTTAEVARRNGCKCVGIELNEEYIAIAARRLEQQVLFN